MPLEQEQTVTVRSHMPGSEAMVTISCPGNAVSSKA